MFEEILRQLKALRDEIEILKTRLWVAGDLVDYSLTSTISGWTGVMTKQQVYYKRVGKLVFVWWDLEGTSDSTATTFTLPSAVGSAPVIFAHFAIDNGGARVSALGVAATSTVTLYKNDAGNAWTNSGTKETYGQFFYQVA